MGKIVLSVISALVMVVGIHHIARFTGASQTVAAASAGAVMVIITALAAVGATFTGRKGLIPFVAAAAFAVFAASAIADAHPSAVGAMVVAVGFGVKVLDRAGTRSSWVLAAYGIELLTAWSALGVESAALSSTFALAGASALSVLWRIGPELTPQGAVVLNVREALEVEHQQRVADLTAAGRPLAVQGTPSSGASSSRCGG